MKAKFEKLCDFFTVEAKSEMRLSTLDFFTFFKRFSKEIEDSMPKEERKRAGAGKTAPVKASGPPSFHAEMMKKLQ